MLFKGGEAFAVAALMLASAVPQLTAQTTTTTVTSNRIGSHGGYTYEYWKDGGEGSMILKEGGAFSCNWSLGDRQNILFRKGLRPGSKSIRITYSGTFNPSGNCYLSCYGWTKNPLIEYYIVESWGSWRPPGGASKGTVTSDGGTYDIYVTTRTNAASIEGTKTFQQFWSVRKTKIPGPAVSGVLTCGNHFEAWAKAGMQMGSFYEVSFKVEGYGTGSKGDADLVMSMSTSSVGINELENPYGITKISQGSNNNTAPRIFYTILGQKLNGIQETNIAPAGDQSILLTPANKASGAYFVFPQDK